MKGEKLFMENQLMEQVS